MRRNLYIWMGTLGILSLIGFGALGYQLVNGLGVTGMNNASLLGTLHYDVYVLCWSICRWVNRIFIGYRL